MMNINHEHHAFSVHMDEHNRQIITDVCLSDSTQNVKAVADNAPNATKCKGLWDTGAMMTVVSSRLVTKLQLPTVSMTPIVGVNGTSYTTTHVIDLWLPNYYVVRKIPVVKGDLTNYFDVLIGMDIIKRGDFSISNYQGKMIFSFRCPSIADTDYVKQANLLQQAQTKKVDRNALCPCGSGRKYKHCCGRY